MEQEWRRIALAIAHKTGKSVGLDMATRKATDADFSVFDDGTAPRTEPQQDINPLDELMRIISETPARPLYRIQFVGGEGERGTSVLKVVKLRASDQSEVVQEASRFHWPPRAIGFRLIDRGPEGLWSRSSIAPAATACCSYLQRAMRRRGAPPCSDAAARSTSRSLLRTALVTGGNAEGCDHGLARPHKTGAGPPGSGAAPADPGAFDQKNNRVREQSRLRGAGGLAQLCQTVALTFLEFPNDLESGMPCLGQFDRGVRQIAAAFILGDEFRDPTDIAI